MQKEWQVAARSRLQQEVGGESLDYPGRIALCPRGHARVIPTRFNRSEFELQCTECKCSYRFREPSADSSQSST
jgi:hypothetical protein